MGRSTESGYLEKASGTFLGGKNMFIIIYTYTYIFSNVDLVTSFFVYC